MFNVLMVAAEASPFVKSGGTADVIGYFARYINKEEFDCRIILPDYLLCHKPCSLCEVSYEDAVLVCEYSVHWGTRDVAVRILGKKQYGTQFYFVNCDEFFSNEVLYTNDRASVERFVFFQKAVIAAMPVIGFEPDIICGDDWEGAMLPMFNKGPAITALIIDVIFWQGEQSMRVGINNVDAIITVSETYKQEIQSEPLGEGLSELVRARRDSLYAIQNGVDYLAFDPETDPALAENYCAGDFVCVPGCLGGGKLANKLALQKQLGLEVGEDKFIACMVCRMVEQKGLDLVHEVMDELMQIPTLQLIFLGDGEQMYLDMLSAAEARYPGRIKALTYFDVGEIVHKIYAGADAYMMPSRFEPCGISQLIAMRYGTVPIVHLTGGLRDTVTSDVGFGFEHYDAQEFLESVRKAERMFRVERGVWNAMANNAMMADHSAETMVRKYEGLFRKLVSERG